MLKLFCAVVGEEGSEFPVDIESTQSVGDLKKAIKKEKSNRIKCDADELQLFLAKKDDGWLNRNGAEAVTLDALPTNFDKMDPLLWIKNAKYFGEKFEPNEGEIHVLVVVPEGAVGSASDELASIDPQSAPHPHRLQRWSKINGILARNKKKARMNEEGFTTPYSSSRWTAVGPVFEEDRMKYNEAIQPIPTSDLEVLSKVLTWIMKCFNWTLIDLKDNEAKRLHVIAPILWAVVQLLPDVTILLEQDLDGNRVDAHGHFEFVLVRGKKRICIVEAKEEKFKQGMAQALLGCEVAADLDDSHEVYAVVTNVEKWVFLKSLDEEILCDEFNALTFGENGVPDAKQLSEVTGKLHSMLTSDQPPPQ